MVSMKTAEREFEFDGSDSKYIKFLEGHLVGCTCKSQLVPRHRQDGQHQISNSESKIRKIEQCTRFLKQIQPSEHWKISRKNSGLCSVRDMTWAIRFLVDDPSLQDEQTTQGIPFRRAQSPSVDSDELRRAESYSRRTADFKLDAKLLHTIIQLRDLMYRLWETVMIERERYSAETVNMISTSRGAQRHRYGGTWTSKLSSKLYAMGWGRRSFEVLAVCE